MKNMVCWLFGHKWSEWAPIVQPDGINEVFRVCCRCPLEQKTTRLMIEPAPTAFIADIQRMQEKAGYPDMEKFRIDWEEGGEIATGFVMPHDITSIDDCIQVNEDGTIGLGNDPVPPVDSVLYNSERIDCAVVEYWDTAPGNPLQLVRIIMKRGVPVLGETEPRTWLKGDYIWVCVPMPKQENTPND